MSSSSGGGRRAATTLRLATLACALLTTVVGTAGPVRASAPGGGTELENNLRGFDACLTFSASAMQTWWTYSPYFFASALMGGNNVQCNNSNMSASWVSTVASQGWDLIPYWYSYQAPSGCALGSFSNYMSSNTSTAYTQGANSAYTAEGTAKNLGFAAGSIIYDDMEAYSLSSSCESAVNSFVNGWCHQLSGDGWQCGMYGSSCASDVSAWYTLANRPGQIWASDPNGSNTAWNLQCMSNSSVWPYDQRTHQSAYNSTESYGGVQLTIDRDCSVGRAATGSVPADENSFDASGTNEANSASEDPSC